MGMHSWAGYVLVVKVSEEQGEACQFWNVCPVSLVPCPVRKCLR